VGRVLQIQQDLLHFISSQIARSEVIGAETDLVTSGILDSMLIVDLIAHIESTYPVRIDSTDITPAAFQNVARLATMISERLSHHTQAA